jgi:hypothetical protein
MGARRKKRRHGPHKAKEATVVHDEPLIRRLADRGLLSPRQYQAADALNRAAQQLSSVTIAQARLSESIVGKSGSGPEWQERTAAFAETISRAHTCASQAHPYGTKVLVAVCLRDTACRTLDRKYGWRNGTAAQILGDVLTRMAEATPPNSPLPPLAPRRLTSGRT